MKYIALLTGLFFGLMVYAQQDCEINTINPDFEEPVITQSGWPTFMDASQVPGWSTTAPDNQIEIWPNSNNGGGIAAYSGSQYIELNANYSSGVYQDFATPMAGIVFNYSFAHSARNLATSGFDVVGVYAGPPGGPLIELGQYSSEVWTGWQVYTGTYTVPAGQTVTRFEFRAVSTASFDNTVGNFLDAIEFTSNFGLASAPEISLSCEDNVATGIVSIGSGSWTIDPGNPSPTIIDDPISNTPTISGFLLSGDYHYTWSNGFCEAELTVHYNNEQIPVLEELISTEVCDNENIIDLTQYNTLFSDELGVSFFYYQNQADADAGNNNFISNPTSYIVNESQTLYVRLVKNHFCDTVLELELNLNTAPVAENPVSLGPECDEDGDGWVEFNLEDAIPLLVPSQPGNLNYTFYLNQSDAESGNNPQNPLVNIATGSTQTYWVVISDGVCRSFSTIILIASESVQNVTNQTELEPKMLCDEDFDEFITVDLTEWHDELILSDLGIQFSYFMSQTDAENETNPITNYLNYPVTDSPTIIWVVIKNEAGCREIRYVEYEIGEKIPVNASEFQLEPFCSNILDLTQLETEISNETGIHFYYYTDINSAESGGNDFIINPAQFPVNSDGMVYVRLEKNGFCPEIVLLIYQQGEEVPHQPEPYGLSGMCEDQTLDLSEIIIQITSDSSVVVNYFETENDAVLNQNPIVNYTAYNPASNSGTLYVRLELTDFCPVVLPFSFERSLMPVNPFDSLPTLCPGNELLLDAGGEYPDENYEWNWEGGSTTGSELNIDQPGTYHLTITTEEGCSETFTLEISQPEPPVILNIQIGDTYIIVETSGNSTALEFSLDGVFWQTNPRFDNLIPGEEYTVFVRESGCDPVSKTFSILFISNFISPNGDGKNDTWIIRGLNNSAECSVKIFDRYGKIFVDSGFQISDNFNWDGKYKGETVPSGDYWYIITTRDEDMVEMKYIGHISVRNR